MDSTLCWEPRNRTKESLTDELKHVLRKKNEDETIHGMILDGDDLEYLQGLQDAGISDVDRVIEAIDKHNAIVLTEE